MSAEEPRLDPAGEPEASTEAALASWLVELSGRLLRGDPAPSCGRILAVDNHAARAVQGLALQRAFQALRDPVARIRLVQLAEAMAAAEKAGTG